MDMSGRIKERRRAVGLSQKQLAERLGISDMTVRRWETTSRKPDSDLLPDLAVLLNTSINYLLLGTDDPAHTGTSSQKLADTPQTQAGQDLDALIKELASKNPDLIIRLRSAAQSLDELFAKYKNQS